MANLYDGVPVFAAADGAVALAADQNAVQAKLILGLEERSRPVPLAGGQTGDAGGWVNAWTIGGAPDLTWVSDGGASKELLFPVNVRGDERITEARIWLSGAAGAPTGGSVVLYKNPLDGASGAAPAETTFGAAGNFWNTGGAISALSAVGLAIDVDVASDYYVGIVGPTAAAVVCTIYGIQLKTQFHKGT